MVSQLCSSHLLIEELAERIKVDGASLLGGQVSFWVDRDIGVVAFVGEKGRDISGSIQSIVI